MIRLAVMFALALAACSSGTVPLPPTHAELRPVAAKENLQGRWTITAVNGRRANGLWLELGGQGLGTVSRTDNGIFVASPQPRTSAHLGCNDWHPNGWTRNGDKLTFGIEMSHRTERGCDPATEALEGEAYAIVRKAMTMEFSPPNRLRLINENGTLDLVRTLTERAATTFIEQNVRAGALLSDAIIVMVRGGFACRRLGRHEYGPTGPDGLGPKEIKMVMCYVAAEHTPDGYQLVYANLNANQQERVVSVYAGSYPVIYRNIKVDSQGRLTVVRDPSQ